VRIFLSYPNARHPEYVGEKDLQERPVIGGQATFEHERRRHAGRVDRIAPENWNPTSALIPAVYVIWS
jgi:hypothetical protein